MRKVGMLKTMKEREGNANSLKKALRVGRRPGESTAREDILDAACERFAEVGYEATTIRSVATSAGVDPALVMHYFKNKEGLFQAVAVDFEQIPETLFSVGSLAHFAEDYFRMWEDPHWGNRIRAVVRSAVGSSRGTELMQQIFIPAVQKAMPLGGNEEEKTQKLTTVGTLLIGTALARYIMEVPMLKDLGPQQLAERLAPALRAIEAS